ncbi:dTDP-4-dehydrorhamnose reductase [Falsirhodobacter halotolerans]|uniref:dTDP-4-dehydrorhamnose reductase n=1 Tax=Falsirhodobacter halotolerans TaxID=1146892 RepID=UPI001FD63262|nr:dTDP-4-dehydrorhamnose reductase [Falsirhodobacter halotolerans]MCJ8138986.1 dTDP-4-dehydrorhamnose reductase [Falsirhodobacter halotolerans]
MILVFGSTGQVAQELRRRLPDATFLSRDQADLSDPAACAAAIMAHDATAVINAAAWTAVDKAETEEPAATVVNGDAPAAMARACADKGIPFVHISTDYVFDGTGTRPWRPEDPTNPIGAYGRSKLRGEEGVAAAGGVHAILRTSWVFSAHGANFVKTMLRLADRGALNVVADQVGGPTAAADIAETCIAMARGLTRDTSGIYHLSGGPDVSWADFAREIFAQAGCHVTVTDIPSSAYPTPAKRPANSRMDCSALATFGLTRPDWRTGLTDVLKDLEVAR